MGINKKQAVFRIFTRILPCFILKSSRVCVLRSLGSDPRLKPKRLRLPLDCRTFRRMLSCRKVGRTVIIRGVNKEFRNGRGQKPENLRRRYDQTLCTFLHSHAITPYYPRVSSHSLSRNPTRTKSSETSIGRLTSIPSVASRVSISSSLIVGSLSFSARDL